MGYDSSGGRGGDPHLSHRTHSRHPDGHSRDGMFLGQEMKRQNFGIPSDSRIQPLIVLTIRDLELLEGSISSGRHSLTDLLTGYLSELVDVDPLCSFYNSTSFAHPS